MALFTNIYTTKSVNMIWKANNGKRPWHGENIQNRWDWQNIKICLTKTWLPFYCELWPQTGTIGAASWQNQQTGMCAQRRLRWAWASAQSDQSLRCLHEEMKKAWFLSYPLSTQRTLIRLWAHSELWFDWADAQADLGLRWTHMPLCWFCHEAAHFSVWKQQTISTCI